MNRLSFNKVGEEEVIEIYLSKEKTPIAFEKKVSELVESGASSSREEAEKWVSETPFVMELCYERDCGLFAVESEAIESTDIYSPYTRELVEVEKDDE